MDSDSPHPLRIAKGLPNGSPTKVSRPLSEISPAEKRRNSPSWRQMSPKKTSLNPDSSPFQSSPLESVTSPMRFWQTRNSENMLYGGGSESPAPHRRPSVERLQKASRVKNSNILALEQKQEYDPTRLPQLERPLAKVQGNNSLGSSQSMGLRSPAPEQQDFGFPLRDSKMSPSKVSAASASPEVTPPMSKDQVSPTKSSLSPSKFKSSFDVELGAWSANSSFTEYDIPASARSLHRHAKSVTFDAAPPQINEYEMATPDLSSIGTNSREGSFDSLDDDEDDDSVFYNPANVGSADDSFDASLEDTDKTPVVGPDDWRGNSPMVGRGRDSQGLESSPMPEGAPPMAAAGRPVTQRNNSTHSSGEHRPLPPLPGLGHARTESASALSGAPGSPGMFATAERMLGSHRSLPAPPPAAVSKSDLQNIGNGKMTLEERLKLMMQTDDAGTKSAAEQQRERRLRRANGRDRVSSPVSEPDTVVTNNFAEAYEEEDTIGDISALDDYQLPPRISRESIMRRVNGNQTVDRESDWRFSSPALGSSPQRSPSRSPARHVPLDPDVPIPSTEDSVLFDDLNEDEEEDGSVIITRQPEDDEISELSEMDRELSQESTEISRESDGSHYSDQPAPLATPSSLKTEEEITTPRAATPSEPLALDEATQADSSSAAKDDPFSNGLESYMLSKPEDPYNLAEPQTESKRHSMADAQAYLQRPFTPDQPKSNPDYDGSGWGEPDDEGDEPGTPDSVIHNPVTPQEAPRDSPAIPEQVATIKASGSKLKTRVSGTPSDLAAMREARRQVSLEIPDVPSIPGRHLSRLSRDMAPVEQRDAASTNEFLDRHPSFKNSSLTLDLDLGLSLDQDFERVIENQKRGYLMRHNTKLVAASDKDGDEAWKAQSAGNSPVKKERPMSWTVEPWDGKMRQKSGRRAVPPSGHAPPMPGQESNATALNNVPEEDASAEIAHPDSGERGRLFVKVLGVKDLDLPIPKNERCWFSLTLDNGVHCVTTAWLEMARNAPIGQEFELVVPNDLEFQLTLNVKLEKPAPVQAPAAAKAAKVKTSTFSRVFASPKKRKELEVRQREEDERTARQQEATARRLNGPPSAYEMLSPLAAEDGSFARAYVCLKEHESRCFGRPYMAEVACFNEWATEEAAFASSVKSKRGNNANSTIVRRAPYKIGKLELQLLFVPRPKVSTDDDMPKSMNSCIRELKAAEERLTQKWEGHLSQQGGDCPYWRRRYFKLSGTKLTAYHEATRQPRASINLTNAKRLIDDKRALTEKETMGKGGRRRRSAFAEEEEGYMFVEEGFRIRFNNGEVIDFYADTREDKEGWMHVLNEVIGRSSDGAMDEDVSGTRTRAKWCELVLKREESLRRRASGRRASGRQASGHRVHSRTKSMYV